MSLEERLDRPNGVPAPWSCFCVGGVTLFFGVGVAKRFAEKGCGGGGTGGAEDDKDLAVYVARSRSKRDLERTRRRRAL